MGTKCYLRASIIVKQTGAREARCPVTDQLLNLNVRLDLWNPETSRTAFRQTRPRTERPIAANLGAKADRQKSTPSSLSEGR
jgi:hypothetical protein